MPHYHRALFLAAALIGLPASLSAQCRLCGQPSLTAAQPVSSGDVQIQIETNLNFDRLILSSSETGAATVRPDGSNAVEGSVLELGPRATVGTVLVHGDPNRTIRITVPRRIQLFSLAGGEITLDDVSTDVAAIVRLDPAGNASFRFGGRLLVSGDCDGPYRGDLPITVEYQ